MTAENNAIPPRHQGRQRMKEGKSYPVRPDKKSYVWWFLTSRRTQVWDYDDEGNLTEPLCEDQESWRHAWILVKHGSWLGKKLIKTNYKLFIRKRPCGCSYNIVTRRIHGMLMNCPEHGFRARWPDVDWDADDEDDNA